MKHVVLVAAAAAVLVFPALGASARHTTVHPMGVGALGAVPPHIGGKAVGHRGVRHVNGKDIQLGATSSAADGPAKGDNLTYGNEDQLDPSTLEGGPVMHSSEVYAMYWVPATYSQGSGTHYRDTIDQFFTDVAADSGQGTNVYSPLQQYFDTTGGIAYDSSFAGSAVDTNAFPSDGCDINQYDGFTIQNTTNCLDDTQLQAEIQSFADAQGWDHGPNVQIFLFTPKNVASCISDPANSSFGQDCSYSDYCAYHSAFFAGGSSDPADEYIYANMPWPNQQILYNGNTYSGDCDGGDHPNGDGSPNTNDLNAADEVIGVTSHEHNEAWSDPLGTGWWVDNVDSAYAGFENGDLCAWYFPDRSKVSGSPAIGSGGAYNQTINGHHYFVQGEWSNKNATTAGYSGCVWNFQYAAETTAVTITGTATVGQVLTGDAGDWAGSPTSYKYEWLRCDDMGDNCKVAKTVVSKDTSLTYTLVAADDKHTMRLRVTGMNSKGPGAPATSDATNVVDGEPVVDTSPSITGTATVGQTLTGDLGTWSPAATSYKITWLRCDNAGDNCKTARSATVKGTAANPLSFPLTKTDDKKTIRFQVVASNAAGVSDTFTTDQTSTVDGEPQPNGGDPAISGTTTVGQTLTGDVGPWSPAATTYNYAWERCPMGGGSCKVIKKGTLKAPTTTTTYKLVAADDKMVIEFNVTASNAAGTSDEDGDSLGPVDGEPESGAAGITGTPAAGSTLTASTDSWSPAATKYKYEWLRCDGSGDSCKVIKTTTVTTASTTYKLVAADNTHTIRVRVTASNSAGSSDAVTSAATAVIGST